MKKQKNMSGITLIALVITIIVLLILAGVTISQITGSENAMQKAREAADKTETANKLDAVKLAVVSSMMEGYDLTVDLDKLKENLANSGIDFDANSLPASIDINGTSYIIDTNGDVTEGHAPEGVTIPNGFVASQATGENNVSTGLVIYEGTEPVTNSNVEIARKTRNQFVWVPADGTNLEYKQDHTYDSIHQYYYSNSSSNANGSTIWTWKDDNANAASVAKYGGFYIGRYEAGWADINQEMVEESTTNVGYGGKNNSSKIPVMKKGYAAWDYVSQTTAKAVSENLYKNSSTVTNARSQLIDSYAWDTTVNWLKNSGIVTETSNGKINSVGYGNYFDATFPVSNVLYLPQRYYNTLTETGTAAGKASTTWSGAVGYRVGSFSNVSASSNKQDTSDNANYSNEYIKPSLSLGATDSTKTNNIYDLAGNLWEWTTEVGDHEQEETTDITGSFAVLRGGSFDGSGSGYPVVYRYGNLSVGGSGYFYFGFRVVLYLE